MTMSYVKKVLAEAFRAVGLTLISVETGRSDVPGELLWHVTVEHPTQGVLLFHVPAPAGLSGVGTDDAAWGLRILAWDKIRLSVTPPGIIDLTAEGAERLAVALLTKAAAARRPEEAP